MTHIAELNLARPRYGADDPRFADFVNALDLINGLAERSPGFVWRLTGAGDDAMDVVAPEDPDLIVNLSVWETGEALEHFVWNTVHKRIYERRAEWFPKMEAAHFVMWPVAIGHRPTVEEAMDRLARYRAEGPSDDAFGWEGLPNLTKWMTARCA